MAVTIASLGHLTSLLLFSIVTIFLVVTISQKQRARVNESDE